MDEKPAARVDDADLGGESACWIDQVCPSCGAIGHHRSGCAQASAGDDVANNGLAARLSAEVVRPLTPPT